MKVRTQSEVPREVVRCRVVPDPDPHVTRSLVARGHEASRTERGGPLAVLPSQLPVLCRRHLPTAFAWVGLYGELY